MALTTKTVTGTLYYPEGSVIGGAKVTFTLSTPSSSVVDPGTLPPSVITVVCGADGTFTTELWPNSLGSAQSEYVVTVSYPNKQDAKIVTDKLGKIQVPSEEDSYTLSDLLAAGVVAPNAVYLGVITEAQYNAAIQAAADAEAFATQAEAFGNPSFNTIALMAAYPNAVVGQTVSVYSGFNGEREDFEATAGGLTADGALVVDGVGVQWVSKRTVYADFAEFDADVRDMTGSVLQFGQHRVEVVVSGEHYETSGGQKVKVVAEDGGYNVRAFGALGDGDQSLYAVNYQTDNVSSPTTITQQTSDAIAINRAIVALRTDGGGSLYVPNGVYFVYGYLERIDFPCRIHGDGAFTVIKNCDLSPTDVNGYGVFHIEPATISEVTLENFTVDGNAHVRTKPTAEFRNYPIALLGRPRLRMNGVSSINSPIDCFVTRYDRPSLMDGDDTLWCEVVNCNFEDAYRNTVSLVSGNNTSFVNCTISGGGYVHDGTNPKFCLDIEPTSGAQDRHILNLKFTNCTFSRAVNAIVGGTWGQAVFTACSFDASDRHPLNTARPAYPWVISFSSLGDWTIQGCKVKGDPVDKQIRVVHYNAYDTISDFAENGWLRVRDTEFEYCGFIGNGRRLELTNVTLKNSLEPFSINKGNLVPQGDLTIRNLTLINVFEGTRNTGAASAFILANAHRGNIDIDGLYLKVDQPLLEEKFVAGDFPESTYHGVRISQSLDACAAAGYLATAKRVYVEGYYQRINNAFSLATSSRDWEAPNLPPVDTNTTNTAAERVVGGRTAAYYSGCTMWGNFS